MNLASGVSSTGVRRLQDLDRIVIAAILISLLWKIRYLLGGFLVYRQLPLTDDFFPFPFQNHFVFLGLYLIAIFSCTFVFLTRNMRKLVWIKFTLTGALFSLCIHQQSYNDITFLTCLWSSIWSTWHSLRIGKDTPVDFQEKGTMFAHLIISLVFLGGAVGKMTTGYWSGEVFFEIYFEGRDFYIYNILRDQFDEPQLRNIAKWHSRTVIFVESFCSLLWLMPRRVASILAILTLMGIAVTNNYLLFSVVSCLIGLASVGLFSPRSAASDLGFGDREP